MSFEGVKKRSKQAFLTTIALGLGVTAYNIIQGIRSGPIDPTATADKPSPGPDKKVRKSSSPEQAKLAEEMATKHRERAEIDDELAAQEKILTSETPAPGVKEEAQKRKEELLEQKTWIEGEMRKLQERAKALQKQDTKTENGEISREALLARERDLVVRETNLIGTIDAIRRLFTAIETNPDKNGQSLDKLRLEQSRLPLLASQLEEIQAKLAEIRNHPKYPRLPSDEQPSATKRNFAEQAKQLGRDISQALEKIKDQQAAERTTPAPKQSTQTETERSSPPPKSSSFPGGEDRSAPVPKSGSGPKGEERGVPAPKAHSIPKGEERSAPAPKASPPPERSVPAPPPVPKAERSAPPPNAASSPSPLGRSAPAPSPAPLTDRTAPAPNSDAEKEALRKKLREIEEEKKMALERAEKEARRREEAERRAREGKPSEPEKTKPAPRSSRDSEIDLDFDIRKMPK